MRHWRINFIFILVFLCGAAIISRLFFLQFYQCDFYKALAQGQQNKFQIIKGDRGKVFFRGGQVLASTTKTSYVFISPPELKNKEETLKELSQILNIEETQLLEKIKEDSIFAIIKNNLSPEEEKAIQEKNFSGVYLDKSFVRTYPYQEMASQIIGFVGGEGEGQYGIEGFYDEILQGEEKYQEDSDNYFSTKGADIYLTLDYNIQFMAEQLLKKAKEEFNIEKGQIIVLDPSNGKILALANFPNFDPNNYSKISDFGVFQNKATQELYEPGSAFKPITISAALDQEKITPQTTYVDKGEIREGGFIISNYGKRIWGERTMTEVLEKSINTGAVFAEQQLDHKVFLDYIKRFGFFEPTNIDLQAEVFSINKELQNGRDINYMTASFGQGIEITPLQLARAFAAVANNGRLAKPFVAEKIDKNGVITETKPEISQEQIISKKTIAQLTAMLVSVVENGYGKSARVPGYYIAGKTGTSEIPWASLGIDKKGYSDKTWQSFIGFGPAFNARFLILVKLDNPNTKTAEYSAVPIFGELAKYIIDYLQIPPDYE